MTKGKEISKISALEYHSKNPKGKLEISLTKSMINQHDLSIAYSPGVAFPCQEIYADPTAALQYTAKGNLVAVISNGTAVLGLGDIGPLASKPVMEGKAVLFKKFADINVFDIELSATDVDHFCDVVAAMEPTFGGINLEDIKSPECFLIEEKLRERMNIPVFHDDQHGTAIVTSAALLNALSIIDKKIEEIKICTTGLGAAGLACLNMFVSLGVKKENILACDEHGVISQSRKNLDTHKQRYARKTTLKTLAQAMKGADMFLGLSVGNICTSEMVASMAKDPILFCLANPTPEISPKLVERIRPDAIIATGRSDFVNQVNNVLCFPFIFRGALDVGATSITDGMKIACAKAIAGLARREVDESLARSYAGEEIVFGRNCILPKPFDSRLVSEIAPAVAQAAMDDNVATRPISDLSAYRQSLGRIVSRTAQAFIPLIIKKSKRRTRIIFAEGEDHRVLRNAQKLLDNDIAVPVLVGRRQVIEQYIDKLKLRIANFKKIEIIDPQNDSRYREYWSLYHEIAARKGVSIQTARHRLHTNNTVIASLLLRKNVADAMICGLQSKFDYHLEYINQILGKAKGVENYALISVAFLKNRTLFIADTNVHENPNVSDLVNITELAVDIVKRFGFVPRVALVSHSNYGDTKSKTAKKMSEAVAALHVRYPDLMIDGEMSPDTALHSSVRSKLISENALGDESANLLVMPDRESASISYKLLMAHISDNNEEFFSVFAGCAYQAHIISNSVSSTGLFNISTYINSVISEENK